MKKELLFLAVGFSTLFGFAQKPSPELLSPTNHALVMIDHEGQMAFATKSISMEVLRDNVGLVVGASKIFNLPTVITTVAEEPFSGPVCPEILEAYPDKTTYRGSTTMRTWE